MKVSETYYNVKCDACGCFLDDENWYPDEEIPTILEESGFKTLGGRHYCMDCWNWDDDDNIITKDGKKFDGETYEEICPED